MSTTAEPSTVPFSTTLRHSTADAHGDAETSALMADLVAGTLPVQGLGDLLGQHLVVYRALEEAGRRLAADPVVAPFLLPGLERTPALEHDVRLLLGAGADQDVRALPATAAYVARLEGLGTWAGGFVAHHYSRYLGDLSGGQVIGRAVARAYPDLPIRFYAFDAIASPKAVKDRYRSLLDEAPWGAEEQARVIEEVRAAYALNTAMFRDLEGLPG